MVFMFTARYHFIKKNKKILNGPGWALPGFYENLRGGQNSHL